MSPVIRPMVLPLATLLVLMLYGCGGASPHEDTVIRDAAVIHELTVPVTGNEPGASEASPWPDDIAGDSAGNVWFALQHADVIGRMTPEGVFTTFPVPTAHSHMDCVVVDDLRHTVWGSQLTGNKIIRMDQDTGEMIEIPIPTPNVFPGDLALAPDGTLWFVEGYDTSAFGKGRIGKVDPATNVVTEIPMPSPRDGCDGILVAPDGAVWFAETFNNRIARYANGAFTEIAMPDANAYPTNIAMDATGRLWVTAQGVARLYVFAPTTRDWQRYDIPTPGASPAGLAIDSAGNVWFSEIAGNKIGVLPAGARKVVEFAVPTAASHPEDIRQIGNRIYFSERLGNKIGWISVPGLTSP